MDKVRCYVCGEYGHMSYDCPHPNKRKSYVKGKGKKESDEEEEKPNNKSRDQCLLAHVPREWVLVSGLKFKR